MAFKDKETRNEYHRKYYKIIMSGFRHILGDKCNFCGYDTIKEVLEFAHKKNSIKKFEISKYRNHTKKEVEIELKKCLLLCPTCHRVYDLK